MLENFEQFGGFSKENEICIIFVGFPNFEIISKFQTAFYNFLGNVSYLFLYIKCVCLKQQILNVWKPQLIWQKITNPEHSFQ